MRHPLELLAMQHLVELSAEIEAQLISKGHEPLKAVLARAREEAGAAMIQMTRADPNEPDAIRELQNIVRRFSDLTRWLRDIVREGAEAGQELDEDGQNDLAALILDMDEHEKAVLGINDGAPTE